MMRDSETIELQEATFRRHFIRFSVEDQFQRYLKKNRNVHYTISKEFTVSIVNRDVAVIYCWLLRIITNRIKSQVGADLL